MYGIYFFPPVKSCGKFPPNFCSNFSQQLPNIMSKSPNIWSKFPLQENDGNAVTRPVLLAFEKFQNNLPLFSEIL